MRRPLFFLLVLGAALLCAQALGCRAEETHNGGPDASTGGTGGSAQPEPLTIVTWNVHNLVDDQHDGAPQEWVEPTAAWEAHRAAVGVVLSDLDADIVMLQEVEHVAVLSSLNAVELDSRYDELIVEEGNDPRGIDVGMLSKVPVSQVISHADDEFTRVGTTAPTYTYSRDCLEVHLTFNGRAIVLLGVHYKAKDNDNPDKRLAEAQHTRAIADEITASAPTTGVIIVGDFNDTPGSTPYDWTVGLVPGGPDEPYTNAPEHVPEADRWTFDYLGNRELVDQMMSNTVLTGMLDTASVDIRHTSDVDDASDHAPVVATYRIH